ncbi:MAG: stage III sporulation protein AF [Clostridia bacterium]|nr:stage III sporulation protein AF [Clostridia bacterium]
MKIYLLSATAVIFLSVIVSLIIPEGKLNKTIVFVMRMVCIFVLIQPITGIFKVSTSATDAPLYDYEYICKVYSYNQSEQLQKLILEKFEVESTCFVNIGYENGEFKADGVNIEINQQNDELIRNIYEYLEELKYINISVYAKSD